jgi:hypothetical protein
MKNPLLIHKISNGFSVAKFSNGISVAAKSAMDKSVTKKSATTNLHPRFAVADSVVKLF